MELKKVCLRVPRLTRAFTSATLCLSMMFPRTVYRQDRQHSRRAMMAAAISLLGLVGAFLAGVLCRCCSVRHDERLKSSEV